MNKITKADLIREYIENDKSMREVAKTLGVSAGTVYNYIKKYGIKSRDGFTNAGKERIRAAAAQREYPHTKRTEEQRKRISDAKKGKYKYKTTYGGHKKNHVAGYVMVYAPDNHRATKDGYVMEHILIVEDAMGRPLAENECVHHINGIKNDNRIENLQVMTASEHMSYHMKKRHEQKGGMTYQ